MDVLIESLYGTIMEVALADDFHKPIIMITNEEVYKKHPFCSEYGQIWSRKTAKWD